MATLGTIKGVLINVENPGTKLELERLWQRGGRTCGILLRKSRLGFSSSFGNM